MMPEEMQEILAKLLFFVFALLMLTFARAHANELTASYKPDFKQVRNFSQK